MYRRPVGHDNVNSSRLEVTRLWKDGTKRISAILPLNIKALDGPCFDQCVTSVCLMDISSITPSELPVPDFSHNLKWLGYVRSLLHTIFPRQFEDDLTAFERLIDASRIAEHLVQLPAEQLFEELNSRFEIESISLLDTITEQDYVFTKINHRCWEEITSIGMANTGKSYIRNIGPLDQECIDSGFYEFMALCLEETAASLDRGNQIRLCSPDFSFGISLTGGNASFADDLRGRGRDAKIMNDIYPAVTIGAAAGLVGFFSTLEDGNHRWLMADGAAPKNLFWEGKFGSFIKRIVESSDAILFIVPPSISGITVTDTERVKVFKVIVPPRDVDTVWTLVAPVVLQHISELSEKYRLTVLSQCSVLSALIGMISKLELKTSKHQSPFRFYDLGQLLDVVNLGQKDTGFWLTRRDVRSHASRLDDWKDVLAND